MYDKIEGSPARSAVDLEARQKMKFRTEIKTRFVDVTIGDKTQKIEEKYEERVPIVPKDWDEISTKAGFALVGVLTLIAIVWSTISIGALLGGGVGFAAAALFDISWAVCLILEWKSRFDPGKRKFPRNLGWALLAVTMFFIGWHGIELNSVPLAVIGACVSLFAKVLWLGVMKHVDKELTPEHAAWVQKTISEANAKMAVAAVLRQVARMEDDAVAQHLAIEMSRHGVIGVEQLLSGQPELVGRQVPDTVRTLSDHEDGDGQTGGDDDRSLSDHEGSGSVLTGSATVRHLSEDDIEIVRDQPSAAALVRTLSDLGVRTLPDTLDAARQIRPDMKPSTVERAFRREEAKGQ